MNLRCAFGGRMFDKCRIGKQFRRVRESLLDVTGTMEQEKKKKKKKEEEPSREKTGKGLEKHRGERRNNRINCFLKKGYDRSEGLSLCGIAINSSPENAAGQVVERVVREQAREAERSADLREE